jgi:hypothetical protein
MPSEERLEVPASMLKRFQVQIICHPEDPIRVALFTIEAESRDMAERIASTVFSNEARIDWSQEIF